jgi:methylglutaconyl-CoA hydratase
MRLLLRPSFSALYTRPTRCYSTASNPLIRVLDVPAPSSGRIRILSLARPAARNAISRALLQELRQNVDSIAAEYAEDGSEIPGKGQDKHGATRVVVLTSEVDSVFCAGADLKERAGMSADEYGFQNFDSEWRYRS